MTEQRPTYHAHSDTLEEDTITTFSRIHPHHAAIPETKDTLFLLPILESPYSAEPHTRCMQLVHLPEGLLGFCNAQTLDYCACCEASVCGEHSSYGILAIVGETGKRCDLPNVLLCETCEHMGSVARTALHTFRRLVNEQRQGKVKDYAI